MLGKPTAPLKAVRQERRGEEHSAAAEGSESAQWALDKREREKQGEGAREGKRGEREERKQKTNAHDAAPQLAGTLACSSAQERRVALRNTPPTQTINNYIYSDMSTLDVSLLMLQRYSCRFLWS